MSSENGTEASKKIARQVLIVIGLIIIAGSAITVAGFTLHIFGLGNMTEPCSQGSLKQSVDFTIVMSSLGFNDSKTHYPCAWPVLNAAKGQTVMIHLVNQDPTDSHAFAITHYFSSGVKLRPGETYDVTFTANQTGTFVVYCYILCTPHTYMLDGQLNVS